MNLDELMNRSVPHERVPTGISPRLRLLAWTALGALGLVAVTMMFARPILTGLGPGSGFTLVGHQLVVRALTVGGGPHVAAATAAFLLVLGAALAIWTRGFQTGDATSQVAVSGLVLSGGALAIPVLLLTAVIVVSLVLWLLLVAVVVAVVGMLLTGLGQGS